MEKNKNGFTLIELLVCIAIIAALSAVVGLSANTVIADANNSRNESAIKDILKAGSAYIELVSQKGKKSECKSSNSNCNVTIKDLIDVGLLDEKITSNVNPTKKTGDFTENDYVTIIYSGNIKDVQYIACGKNYNLSTIDNCTKDKNCEWGVC